MHLNIQQLKTQRQFSTLRKDFVVEATANNMEMELINQIKPHHKFHQAHHGRTKRQKSRHPASQHPSNRGSSVETTNQGQIFCTAALKSPKRGCRSGIQTKHDSGVPVVKGSMHASTKRPGTTSTSTNLRTRSFEGGGHAAKSSARSISRNGQTTRKSHSVTSTRLALVVSTGRSTVTSLQSSQGASATSTASSRNGENKQSGDTQPSNSPKVNGGSISKTAALGIGMSITTIIIALIITIIHLWRVRKRRRASLSPNDPQRNSRVQPTTTAAPKVNILAKDQRAMPLPERNRWSVVLPRPSARLETQPALPMNDYLGERMDKRVHGSAAAGPASLTCEPPRSRQATEEARNAHRFAQLVTHGAANGEEEEHVEGQYDQDKLSHCTRLTPHLGRDSIFPTASSSISPRHLFTPTTNLQVGTPSKPPDQYPAWDSTPGTTKETKDVRSPTTVDDLIAPCSIQRGTGLGLHIDTEAMRSSSVYSLREDGNGMVDAENYYDTGFTQESGSTTPYADRGIITLYVDPSYRDAYVQDEAEMFGTRRS